MAKHKNYAQLFWPQWCIQNRTFLSEDSIVADIITKIKNDRKALLWWVLIEESDVLIFYKKKKLIIKYYGIGKNNPHFHGSQESLDEIQIRILQKVWKGIHTFDDQLVGIDNGSSP